MIEPCRLSCATHCRAAFFLSRGNWDALYADLPIIRHLSRPRSLWGRHCRCNMAGRVILALKEHGYAV